MEEWTALTGPLSGCVIGRAMLPSEEGTPNFQDFDLKAQARIWPWLSYMLHIRSTAVQVAGSLTLGILPHVG